MAHPGLEPWPISSLENMLTAEPASHWLNRLQNPLINRIHL